MTWETSELDTYLEIDVKLDLTLEVMHVLLKTDYALYLPLHNSFHLDYYGY